MQQPTYTEKIADFLETAMLPHKSLASMAMATVQNSIENSSCLSDMGTILAALNTLMEIRMDTLAAQVENSIGTLMVEQTKSDSSILSVFINSSETGVSGDTHVTTREGGMGFIVECVKPGGHVEPSQNSPDDRRNEAAISTGSPEPDHHYPKYASPPQTELRLHVLG